MWRFCSIFFGLKIGRWVLWQGIWGVWLEKLYHVVFYLWRECSRNQNQVSLKMWFQRSKMISRFPWRWWMSSPCTNFANIVSIIPFSSSLVREVPIWILQVNHLHGKCILDDKLTRVLNMDSIKCSIKV
jgi:hypothetical protein